MDRRIWGQIVEWLQIPEIQVAIFFIVEFGDTFLLEQFYRSEQADAEFVLGEGFRLHRMPDHHPRVQKKSVSRNDGAGGRSLHRAAATT